MTTKATSRLPLLRNLPGMAAWVATLCVMLAAEGVQTQAQAPTPTSSERLYFNTSTTIPVGRYESPVTIHLVGAPISNNDIRGLFPAPIEVSVDEGTEFHGVNLTIGHTNFRARNVHFKGGTIEVHVGARVSFEDCLFEGVTFMMNSGLPPAHAPGGLYPAERYRAHLELRNSVLNKVQFHAKGGPDSVMGLKMENCSMYGPGSMLPMLLSRPGLLANLKTAQTEVNNCSFIQCSYTSPFLAITQNCTFDSCTMVPGLPLPEITTTPLQIAASFHPIETSDQITAQLSQYTLVPVDPAVPSGCKLEFSITKGEISRNQLPSVLPMKALASVLPAPSNTTLSITSPLPTSLTPGTGNSSTFTTNSTMQGNQTVTPTLGAPDTGLKLNQTNVHGLLIMSLGSGEAGSASKMAAIALKGYSTDVATVRFNQPVGAMMAKALQEVTKFTQVNQGGWPRGYQIELSFADKYSNKDGPSAAVACALLLHSLITGKELDQAFAVTGDMNADGSVQPIGGVAAKIRGATKGHCKLIGIPSKNESALGDLLLSDGPAPFASIQIYSLQHFRDAEALATAEKPAATQAAIAEMKSVQEVLLRNPGQMGNWLRNQHVIGKLQQVLKDSPNNLSAKYLLMYASGKVPQTLTLAGSLSAIDDAAGELLGAIKSNRSQSDAFNTIGKASVGSSITRMQALRTRCDARVRPYADAIIGFGLAVKEAQDRPPQSESRATELRTKINAAATSTNSTFTRIINDPVIREELEK